MYACNRGKFDYWRSPLSARLRPLLSAEMLQRVRNLLPQTHLGCNSTLSNAQRTTASRQASSPSNFCMGQMAVNYSRKQHQRFEQAVTRPF